MIGATSDTPNVVDLETGAIVDVALNRGDQHDAKGLAARRALRRAQRTTRSTSGRALMRRRGELGERSFVHVLDYGGARRMPLRGGKNILKRYRIQAAGANLALLLRHVGGIGTLKQSWAASKRALLALLRVLETLLHRLLSHSHGQTIRRSDPRMAAVHLPRSVRDGPPYRRTSTVC